MNIGVIGVGGVGGYFGGKLCLAAAAMGTSVYFVARGRHLNAIRRNGLYLTTAADGEEICMPTLATDNFDDLPLLDVCLVCVKSYDLEDVLLQVRNKVSEATLVLPLLNGVDIYERIRMIIDKGRVFPACVYVGTHIEAYGKVTQRGGACKVLFGRDPGAPAYVPTTLFGLFQKADVRYAWFEDARPEIWTKYIFIAAFGLVTAAHDKTLGEVMESNLLGGLVLSVMGEILSLAQRQGVALPETSITASYEKGHDFPFETKTSFQRDVEQPHKQDERDLFGGTILRMGKSLNIPTPVTAELCARLDVRKPTPSKAAH